MAYPHKWSPISCRSSAGQGKFAGQRPTFYHCATPPTGQVARLYSYDTDAVVCVAVQPESGETRARVVAACVVAAVDTAAVLIAALVVIYTPHARTITTCMGDRLRAGILSRYVTQGQYWQ